MGLPENEDEVRELRKARNMTMAWMGCRKFVRNRGRVEKVSVSWNVQNSRLLTGWGWTDGDEPGIVGSCGSIVGSHQREDDDHDDQNQTCQNQIGQTRSCARCAQNGGPSDFRAEGHRR